MKFRRVGAWPAHALIGVVVALAALMGAAVMVRAGSGAGQPGHLAALPAPDDALCSAPGQASDFQRDMAAGMARMMADMHAPGYSGQADIDFLAMMIPHHAGAVDMARLVLLHGQDPATRQLAEDIIATQTIEVASMSRRLAALRQQGSAPEVDFPPLGGLRGPGQNTAH